VARTVLAKFHMRQALLVALTICVAIDVEADVWSRAFIETSPGLNTDVAEVRDGTLLVVEQNLGGPCVARLKHDSVDRQCYGFPNENSGGSVAAAQDGYFIYGSSYRNGQSIDSGFVFRIDSAGNLKWSQRYVGSDDVRFLRAVATSDGGLVVVGSMGRLTLRSGVYGLVALAMKIDGAGKIQWQRTFDTSGADVFADVT
jgi:hypothetical protein